MTLSKKEIVFTFTAWILGLVIINALCGLIARNRYIALDPVSREDADRVWGFFAPDQDKVILFPGLADYHVRTNALGFRDTGLPLAQESVMAPGSVRILILGDSISFGLYVDDEDTYPYLLQQRISQRFPQVYVLNAGIGGATITDYLDFLERKGDQIQPHVIIFNYTGNDLGELEGWQQSRYQAMLESSQFSLAKQLKLMKFMRMFRKVDLTYKFYRTTLKIKDPAIREIPLKPKTDIASVLAFEKYQAGQEILSPQDPSLAPLWKRYCQEVLKLRDYARERGIVLMGFIYPDILTVWGETSGAHVDILTDFFEREGIDSVDLIARFRARKEDYLKLYNQPPRDNHLARLGNEILAEVLYEKIQPFLTAHSEGP